MQEKLQNISFNINKKNVAQYTLLPGIFPLLQRLVGNASKFLFVFTQLFGAIGLIDRNHPCLKPENAGRYRFGDVVGLAASNVVFDKDHIPQIVMFFSIIGSIVLTFAIGLGLIAATVLSVNSAHAQLFGTPTQNGYTENNDWALQFLFRIFGDSAGMFPNTGGNNPWFTSLLTGMLSYYSLAMMVIAAFMILYLLVITFVESAKTGQPFGTRFDGVWAPIRIALAMGLLIPITSAGYNGAQLITFQAAKWGSNLATNVWYGGIGEMNQESQNFFSSAMTDPGYRFIRDIFLVNLCVESMQQLLKSGNDDVDVEPLVWSGVASTDTVTYTFGPKNAPDFCGKVTVQRASGIPGGGLLGNGISSPDNLPGVPWPEQTIADYHRILSQFLPIAGGGFLDGANIYGGGEGEGNVNTGGTLMGPVVQAMAARIIGDANNREASFVDVAMEEGFTSAQVMDWIRVYWNQLGMQEVGGVKLFFRTGVYPGIIANYNNWIVESLRSDSQYGWTTAGVFYLRMSTAMSTISKVVNNPPRVSQLPSNLSKSFATPDNPNANTQLIQETCNGFWSGLWDSWFGDGICDKYALMLQVNSFLVGGKTWFLHAVKSNQVDYQRVDGENFDRELMIAEPESSTNLNAGYIFRPVLDGLSNLARIPSGTLNPLGAVIVWGNTLMALSFIAYGIAVVSLGSGMASLAIMLGNILLLPGFILAFWIPMMPFLYFTFAVIEWMMSVLEAIIAMPLFALSFITLQGDGIGGAMKGLKKLFEIMLRPTMIIISLLAAVLVFTAGITFFNSAIDLYARGNVSANPDAAVFQSAASGFGMVFIYMFAIYTLATSCFKLITVIPNQFGKWLGLEPGFGALIKTGPESMDNLSKLIVAGAAFRGLSGATGAAQDKAKHINQKRAAKRAKDQ